MFLSFTRSLNTRLNLFLFFSIILAIYVGWRMPSTWSIHYYIPSFFEGFIRRGLMGTLLYPLGHWRLNYNFLASFQISILAVLLIGILRLGFKSPIENKTLLILFFLAPTGGYFFHIVGYIDQLLYLLLMISLFSTNRWVGLWLMIASLFIHEAALFTTIPIYLCNLYINQYSKKWIIFNILLIGTAFCCLTVFFQTVSNENIRLMFNKDVNAFGDNTRLDYYIVFFNKFTQQALTNQTIMLNGQLFPYAPHGDFTLLYFEIAVVIILAIFVAREFISITSSKIKNLLSFFTMFFACICPLFLVFFGFDQDRWVFLTYSSTLTLFFLRKKSISSERFLTMMFLMLLFLAYGHLNYFDGYSPRVINWPVLKSLWT